MALQKFQSTFTWPELEPNKRVPIKGRAEPIRGDYAAPMSAKKGNPFQDAPIDQKPAEKNPPYPPKGYREVESVRTFKAGKGHGRIRRGKKLIRDEEIDSISDYGDGRPESKLRKFGNWAGKWLVK